MAELGFAWVNEREITVGLLCDLQRILAKASRRPPRDPGEIRAGQVIIGPEDVPFEEARFVPSPPGDQLRGGFDAWQLWLYNGPMVCPSS